MTRLATSLCAALLIGGSSIAYGQQPAAQSHVHSSPAAIAAAKSGPSADGRIQIPDVRSRLETGQKITFVDARSKISGAMIEGAEHVPVADAAEWAKDLDKDTLIVAYCACGSEGTSLAFVKKLEDLGFTNVYALQGGIQGWQAAGLPTSN